MLEVGTSSGGIAHYFSAHEQLRCDVDAVDVYDNRPVSDSYRYHSGDSTQLPFADQSFDVVLSNHVIEHVSDEQAQHAYLAELHRVLRLGGVGYLAVPNRWMLVDPRHKLAFLSWLRHAWRTSYLRVVHQGDIYDCEPSLLAQLERLPKGAGFKYRNPCVDALRSTFEIERPQSTITNILRHVPDGVLISWHRIIPNLIY